MKKIQYIQFIFAVMLVCWLPMQAQAVQTSGIITVAGGVTFPLGDGGPALSAGIRPSDVAFDSLGNYYIAERSSGTIRKVNISTGIITTIAGGGSSLLDNIAATTARFVAIEAIAIDNNDNLYIADALGHKVRKVVLSTGMITTFAGTGVAGSAGLNGLATSAQLNSPSGVAFDVVSNRLYIADTNNHRIVSAAVTGTAFLQPSAGTVGVAGFSGDGSSPLIAQLNKPTRISFDSAGNYYVVDSLNYRIRKVAAGVITTVAGIGTQGVSSGDGGAATAAIFRSLRAVSLDSYANIYIGDDKLVRKVDSVTGIIRTISGAGSSPIAHAFSTLAKHITVTGVTVDPYNNIYIADSGSSRVYKIFADNIPPTAPTITSPTSNEVMQNIWNVAGLSDPYTLVYFGFDGAAPGPFDSASVGLNGWVVNATSGGSERTEGSHTVTVYAVDGAGNVSPETTVSYVVDQTPPVITIIGDNPLTVTEGTYNDPGATALDAVTGDATASIYTTGPSIFGSSNLTDGQTVNVNEYYNIMYVACDAVGNCTDQASGTSLIRAVNVIADPNASAAGGSAVSSGSNGSSGGDSGGGGCLVPTPSTSFVGLLPMLGLFLFGLAMAKRNEDV